MFTGIIEDLGTVTRVTRKGEDALLIVDTAMNLVDINVGDSISVSGACLTVTEKGDKRFSADVSAETLARTNLKSLKSGDKVNLEKSLRLNSLLGGHLVLGHVDGIGKIQEKVSKANSIQFSVEIDPEMGRNVSGSRQRRALENIPLLFLPHQCFHAERNDADRTTVSLNLLSSCRMKIQTALLLIRIIPD